MSRSVATRLLRTIAVPAMLAIAALHTHATPVSVSDFSFVPGSGYGVDDNESSGTRLNVVFSGSSFSAQSFTLGAAGDSRTFTLGTVQFLEDNSHSGILASETDGLEVAASLTFLDPFSAVVQMLVTGSATIGAVSDAAVDFTIDWNPVQMAFGSGGLLEIALNDLNFTGMQTLTQSATITLLRSEGVVTPQSTVPEPGSLALMGAAFAGLAFCRRRRR